MCDDQKSLQNINSGCLLESLEDSYFLVFVFGPRTLRFLDCLFLGLERSPSPGFVRDCWCPVPVSLRSAQWRGRLTLVLVGPSCLIASSGCGTALIKLQGKAPPILQFLRRLTHKLIHNSSVLQTVL